MGNQTLVPSQIQSVESYFLDLKSYIQFRSSLGSTTFMKTAKVNLIESNSSSSSNNSGLSTLTNDELLVETRNLHVNESTVNANASSAPGGGTIAVTAGAAQSADSSSLQPAASSSATVTGSAASSVGAGVGSSGSSTGPAAQQPGLNKLSQLQTIRQRLQQLRDSQQPVVVKVFPKYDASIRLDLYSKRVREIKSIVQTRYGMSTNCLPFAELVITERAAFLFRQFVRYNLYDRLSTRPFLTLVEKKWITFQLLCAVNEIHSLQIVHGDIKVRMKGVWLF